MRDLAVTKALAGPRRGLPRPCTSAPDDHEDATGRTFTLRLSASVDGGAGQSVDEVVTVGALAIREGVCGP